MRKIFSIKNIFFLRISVLAIFFWHPVFSESTPDVGASILFKIWNDQIKLAQEASFLNMGKMSKQDFSSGRFKTLFVHPDSFSAWHKEEIERISHLRSSIQLLSGDELREHYNQAVEKFGLAVKEFKNINSLKSPNEFIESEAFNELTERIVDNFEILILIAESAEDLKSFPIRLARVWPSLPVPADMQNIKWMGSGTPYSSDEPSFSVDRLFQALAVNVVFFAMSGLAITGAIKLENSHPVLSTMSALLIFPAIAFPVILTGKGPWSYHGIVKRFAHWRWADTKLKGLFASPSAVSNAFQLYILMRKYLSLKKNRLAFPGFSVDCRVLISRFSN